MTALVSCITTVCKSIFSMHIFMQKIVSFLISIGKIHTTCKEICAHLLQGMPGIYQYQKQFTTICFTSRAPKPIPHNPLRFPEEFQNKSLSQSESDISSSNQQYVLNRKSHLSPNQNSQTCHNFFLPTEFKGS